jgi:hypothetical protein
VLLAMGCGLCEPGKQRLRTSNGVLLCSHRCEIALQAFEQRHQDGAMQHNKACAVGQCTLHALDRQGLVLSRCPFHRITCARSKRIRLPSRLNVTLGSCFASLRIAAGETPQKSAALSTSILRWRAVTTPLPDRQQLHCRIDFPQAKRPCRSLWLTALD